MARPERESGGFRSESPYAGNPPDAQSARVARGDVLTAISGGLVALLKEFYGRGPTRAKSYYEDDLVVCLLRGGFTRVEQTLLEGGRGSSVIQQRMGFQELMRQRFEAVIEAATGRQVIGFMSGNQQHPDLCARSSSSRPPTSSTTTSTPIAGGPAPPDRRGPSGKRTPLATHLADVEDWAKERRLWPDRDELFLYYGAADTCIGLATARCSEVLDYLLACPPG